MRPIWDKTLRYTNSILLIKAFPKTSKESPLQAALKKA